MNRRHFLNVTGSAGLLALAGCATSPRHPSALTIIDCHTHFFDPTRPEGVPWPGSESELYKPTFVRDYLAQPVPHPVAGTVVVEASPWVEDNQWILDLAEKEPIIMGLCGNLNPLDASFPKNLERFATNARYRGIRVSGDVIQKNVTDFDFMKGLSSLVEYNLQLDVNGPPDSLPSVDRLARALPSLRIVIDHLANVSINVRTVDPDWTRDMERVARNPHVFAKVSGLVEAGARAHKPAAVTTDYYAGYLEVLWRAFGPDRLVYGSNWPVCGLFAPLYDVQRIVTEYFSGHGRTALQKVFANNAASAYGPLPMPGSSLAPK